MSDVSDSKQETCAPEEPRKHAGRPTKISKERVLKIIEGVSMYSYPEVAAQRAGIGKSTYYAWMAKARAGEGGLFQELLEGMQRARAEAEMKLVAQWAMAAKTDWRAAMELLARQHPERYGRRDRIDANVSGSLSISDLIVRSYEVEEDEIEAGGGNGQSEHVVPANTEN